MMNTRKPAVSGQFYPGSPNRLSEEIEKLIDPRVTKQKATGIVAPHAGYIYSGQVAGLVFSNVQIPKSVIILGPNHTGYGPDASIMDSGNWQMPLGMVEIDQELSRCILEHSDTLESDVSAQMLEHSIEVQVPFIQFFQPHAQIVPIVLRGDSIAMCKSVARSIAKGIQSCNKDVLIIASTDLTHYKSQHEANQNDHKVIDRILNLDPEGLLETVKRERISMCGVIPVTVMLIAAKEMGARSARLIKYMTSGDVTGDFSQVVGYAGMVIE